MADGIEKARKHRLPGIIEDIIAQHHGTTMVGSTLFYDKAVTESKERGTIAKEDDFRYPGPRPQTKEAAIILLADSVEAASRSMVAKGCPSSTVWSGISLTCGGSLTGVMAMDTVASFEVVEPSLAL